MKVRIELEASEASAAVHALAAMADAFDGVLKASALGLAHVVRLEDLRTTGVFGAFEDLVNGDLTEGDLSVSVSDAGDCLDGSLDGELVFDVDEAIGCRREAREHGDLLLDMLARLSRLELTAVSVKLGRTKATLEQAAHVVILCARHFQVELPPLSARSFDDEAEATEEDDENEEEEDEQDDEDDEEDDEDDEPQALDDEGFPAGGWGHPVGASSPRRQKLGLDEELYLLVAELSWPCSAADVRARRLHALAKRHPDPIRVHNPDLADRYEEEYKRLQHGYDALLVRCAAAGRR